MDLIRALEVFRSVMQHRSFAAAASELGISTTSVSRIILELENELGGRLINRSTRQLSITDVGGIVYQRARDLLTDLDELRGSVRTLSDTAQGTIRLTCPISFGERLLMPLIPRLLQQHPKLSVEVSLCNRYVDLIDEGFDVAIRIAETLPLSVIARRLGSIESLICAAPEYLASQGLPAHPEELAGHSCVVYRSSLRTFDRWTFRNTLRGELSVQIRGRLYVDSTDALRVAVLGCCGFGLFPLYAVDREIAQGLLQPVLSDFTIDPAEAHIIYPDRRHLSRKVRTLVDFLVANLRLPALPAAGRQGEQRRSA